jgi:GNAT superfamily N-acetyltransferase
MRILNHDELSSDLEVDVQLLRLSVSWPPRDFHRMEQARKAGFPAPDYVGLYAVEDNRVVSTVRVVRLPFTFPDLRTETVSVIQSVITRRDCRGRGLARELINRVNTREREAGSKFSLLWTEHSLQAHQLYEHMGYRDVYTVDLAQRAPSRRAAASPNYAFRRVKDDDVAKVEQLHKTATQGRIGFTPRNRGFLNSILKLGLDESHPLHLILKEGVPVGYLALEEAPSWVKVTEVVMEGGPTNTTSLIADLERISVRRWLSIWNTFVRDSMPVLKSHRYVHGTGDRVLMSLPLESSLLLDQESLLGVTDPRFTCQALDYF